MDRKTVLFICTYNSVRSQMAEGLLTARCGDRYATYSAGIAPAGVNPFAVSVMAEIGIDISGYKSKKIDLFRETEFDYIITLCDHARLAAAGSLPTGRITLHRGFLSPSELRKDRGEILKDFRRLRDSIGRYIFEIFPECAHR